MFSTLNANLGYLKTETDENDREITTFTSHHGLYLLVWISIGLKNAPATFQNVMDVIFSSIKWGTALVYLDDSLVFSQTIRDHMAHNEQLLTLLANV